MPQRSIINSPKSLINLPIDSIQGLRFSNFTATQVRINAGYAIVPHNTNPAIKYFARLTSNQDKSLSSAWSFSGSGGRLGATAVATNQTWHVFIIYDPVTDTSGIGFDVSVTGSNVPSQYHKRMIGSIMTTPVSTDIIAMLQVDDYFEYEGNIAEVSSTSYPTTNTNLQSVLVPSGLNILYDGVIIFFNAIASSFIGAGSGLINAAAPGVAITQVSNIASTERLKVFTNTNRQIRLHATNSNTNLTLYTHGFTHPRGR